LDYLAVVVFSPLGTLRANLEADYCYII